MDVPGTDWPDTRILLDRIETKARKFGGIQHWGMNHLLDASDVARAYPRLDTWRRVRWALTNNGTLTAFDNDFTRRCGLSAPPTWPTGPLGRGWTTLPGLAKEIGVGANGAVWVIGTNPIGGSFGIHRWNGAGWDAVDGGAVRVAVGPDGQPWVVNDAGNIFRRE